MTSLMTLKDNVVSMRPGDAAWAPLAKWLSNAYWEAESSTTMTRNGINQPKTAKQRQIDLAVFDALAKVVADYPEQPLGMTTYSVRINLGEIRDKAPQPTPKREVTHP